MNPYPQKKIMTFNNHVKDFSFNVDYADLDYLGETEIAWLGSNNITSVLVKGVKEALDNNTGENVETKGVKAHFGLDDSGILTVTSVESVFEKTISVEEQEKREKEWKEATEGIDWSKLGDNIKSFFGTDEAKPEEGADDDKKEKSDDKKDEKKYDSNKKDGKKDGGKKEDKKEKVKEPKKPKVESVKVELSTEGSRNDVNALDGEMFAASQGKLEALAKADADRAAIELALNELQGYSVDLVDKLEDEEFQAASTDEEREKLSVECSAVSDWLDEEAGVFTPVEEFQTKLKSLKGMAAPVMARLREHKERPEALDMLKQSLNSSRVFLEKSRDLVIPAKPKDTPETAEGSEEKPKDGEATSDDKKIEDSDKDKKKSEKQDEGLFTAKELESLEKKIYEVEKWRDDKLEEQEKQPLSEMPKLTVSLIKSKIQDLDSEVQLLIGKARMIKAERERAKRKAEEEKKKEEEKAKKEKKKKKKEKVKEAADEEGKKTEDTSEETTEPPVPNDDDSTTNSSEEKPADADTTSETTDDSSDTKDSDEVGDDNEDKDETEHTEL